MEIINTSFPTGNKFYPIENVKTQEKCAKVFSLKMYQAAEFISNNVSYSSNEYLGSQYVSPWFNSLELCHHHEEFPRFKINYYVAFKGVSESVNAVILHKKTNYQSINRIRDLGNMPWHPGMTIQWDNVRKGFIVFDIPYEGELITVPKSGISKAITEILKDIVAEAGMFELLGESTYIDSYYSDSVKADKAFRNAFEALLNGTQTTKQTTDIAIGSGAYYAKYDNEEATKIWKLPPKDRHYRYYKLTRLEKNKPKISTITRTQLMYKYGGLKLPENYQEWFDG